jgi:hypothetical protein
MNSTHTIRGLTLAAISIALITSQAGSALRAVDIAPMSWTAGPRTHWINVKSPGAYTQETTTPNAVGDGVTDDTAAIQGVLNWINNVSGTSAMGRREVAYFPPGTYKITATLTMNASTSCSMIGSGSNTIISWYGPSGAAMAHPQNSQSRYEGFVWDGRNIASCGYLEDSPNGYYMTAIRHENESFRNFTTLGTYYAPTWNDPSGAPGAGIIAGFQSLCGEMTIFNCRFYNCTEGVRNPVDIFNNYMWLVEGCEFDSCGTGVDGSIGGANMIILNCHFQGSTVVDIAQQGNLRGQRLTSSGSNQFFNDDSAGLILRDCWIDGWTNTSCALSLGGGAASLTDFTFTNPPSGAAKPIYATSGYYPTYLTLSNLNAPKFPSSIGLSPGMDLVSELNGSGAFYTEYIPPGSLGSSLTSASQTFLKSTYPADSTNILNIQNYGADDFGVTNDGSSDSTAAIQAAINDAATANNGTIVYIPAGFYNISSLNLTGGNYIIEGDGVLSELYWNGGGTTSAMMNVTNPQNITIRNINLTVWNNSISAIKETATGASSATYDGVFDYNAYAPGITLSGLPAGAKVYIPELDSALTVNDCGPAQIFSLRAYIGGVNVSGSTRPKTGYLGLMMTEGGLDAGRPYVAPNPSLYNFNVLDNQNLLVGPYYSEQCYNGLNLQKGSGTTPGHVAIEGTVESPSPVAVSINANNYLGRLFYPGQLFFGGYDASNNVSPVQITQTGSNHLDLVLSEDTFDGSAPTVTLDTGANLVEQLCSDSTGMFADEPNPLTPANLAAISRGNDDFRQLGAINLSMEYGLSGLSGLVAYWKLDEPVSPVVDTSMNLITGTLTNAPTYSTDTPTNIPYSDTGSMAFNGTNQYVAMGNPAALPSGTGARTICAWAKSNSVASGSRVIASFGTAATGKDMYIGMSTKSLVGGGFSSDLSVSSFWDTNWHFIALTYDGTTANLYADGVLKSSAAKSWNLTHSACNIGAQPNGTALWNGNIDDVRIYNRALSAAEIAALISTPPASGTLLSGVSASSTSANLGGTPALTVSNNCVVAGSSAILGASDSMGDSGYNQDGTVFGAWLTNLTGANITYDLGGVCTVNNLLVWNFSESGHQSLGANSVTVQTSTDNLTYTTLGTYTLNEVTEDPGTGSNRPIPGNNPPYALGYPNDDVVPAQVVPVTIPSARYVKLVLNSNWGGGSQVGLNEVNFLGSRSVYDLANDFNYSSDSTSNSWAYGVYTTAGNPSTFSIPSATNYSTTVHTGMGFWNLSSGTDPNIEKNLTASNIITGGTSSIEWKAGKVSFGPYTGPAVARFTAPSAGHYKITATFQTDQKRGNTGDGTNAYVYTGGTNVYTQVLSDPSSAQLGTAVTYTGASVLLTAGETVDFVVGGGAFTTQVAATLTMISP